MRAVGLAFNALLLIGGLGFGSSSPSFGFARSNVRADISALSALFNTPYSVWSKSSGGDIFPFGIDKSLTR